MPPTAESPCPRSQSVQNTWARRCDLGALPGASCPSPREAKRPCLRAHTSPPSVVSQAGRVTLQLTREEEEEVARTGRVQGVGLSAGAFYFLSAPLLLEPPELPSDGQREWAGPGLSSRQGHWVSLSRGLGLGLLPEPRAGRVSQGQGREESWGLDFGSVQRTTLVWGECQRRNQGVGSRCTSSSCCRGLSERALPQ